MYSPKCEEMRAPVCGLNRSVLNRLAAVDHHSFANINPDMCRTWCAISILEEYQITGSCLLRRDIRAVAAQAVRRCPWDAPAVPAMIDHPAYKA